MGNSGPPPEAIGEAGEAGDLVVAAVLSGNRNFEGRISPQVRANYLASPPLVVAYAIAGSMNADLATESLGDDQGGKPVYLRDIWPSTREVQETLAKSLTPEMFRKRYGNVFEGPEEWRKIETATGMTFKWQAASTYVQHPPFFENMPKEPEKVKDIHQARLLAILGDSITTDHISPAGSIKKDGPAGNYLMEFQVRPSDFNSHGSR